MPSGRSAAWEERSRSFGAVAGGYAALRPGYPAAAVDFLLGGDWHPPRRVLDLAAGTGLLTEPLVAAGHEVVAVDPAAGMLDRLRERLPGVVALVGSAEAIPLPDADVDLVTAAQAAHWFDPAPAAAELRRVVRPGGVVGLVWNMRDESSSWLAGLRDVLATEHVERFDDRTVVDVLARELDAAVETWATTVVQRVPPEAVVEGIATRSYVATMTDQRRAEFLGSVRDLLAEHPDSRGRALVDVPYRTTAWRLTPR